MKTKAYQLLMILQGIFWFYVTVQGAASAAIRVPILILIVLDGVVYILLSLADLQKPLFKLAVPLFLVGNTILTVTDQMGFLDYLILGWNLVLLAVVSAIVLRRSRG